MENLLLALFVLVVILIFKHWTTGFLSSSAILIGIPGRLWLPAFLMGFVLPTTGVTADGVEYTKAGAQLGQGGTGFLVCHPQTGPGQDRV